LRYPLAAIFIILLLVTLPYLYKNADIFQRAKWPEIPENVWHTEEETKSVGNITEDISSETAQPASSKSSITSTLQTKQSPTQGSIVERDNTSTSANPAIWEGTDVHWMAYAYGMIREELDIYILDLWTSNTKQITSGKNLDEAPTFSPDGRFLAYTSCRGDCEIYKFDLTTNKEVQLTDLPIQAKFPDWCRNPNKSWIIFEGRTSNRAHQLWMVDVGSNEATPLLTSEPSASRPGWSPSCTQAVFGRANKDTDRNGSISGNDFLDLYILDIKSKTITQVIDTPDKDEFSYVWSPDGNWIAFTRISNDTNQDGFVNLNDQSDLFIIHPDGTGEVNLTLDRFSVFSPSWTYDSQNIAFTDFISNGKQEIWSYNLLTKEFNRITEAGPYYHPAWSP